MSATGMHNAETQSLLAPRQAEALAAAVADASSKASTVPAARVASGQSREIHWMVLSTVALTAYMRVTSAGRTIVVDTSLGAIVANTATGGKYVGVVGDEAELVFDNASGSAAAINYSLRAI